MIKLMQGDCLERMNDIDDGSIDMILADPPYGTVKGMILKGQNETTVAWDSTIDHTLMLEQCNRVLRKNGALILFSQDPYTAKLTNDVHGNLPFSYRLTWLKDHFANPLSANKVPVNYTEDLCVFFKKYDDLLQHPLRKYAEKIMLFIGMNLKEINKGLGHRRSEHFFYIDSVQFGLCTEETYNELIEKYNIKQCKEFMIYSAMEIINHRFNRTFNLSDDEKYKSNVFEYKKDYMGLHPTQKPVALIEDLIETYTNEDDTVLDFTMGSGTTGVACKNLNRDFIGIELDVEYFRTASERITGDPCFF